MYPLRRNRRLRTSPVIRDLVRETCLSPDDFLVPLFVTEGKGVRDEIPSMPGYFRLSLDGLEKEVKELWTLGLKAVLLFVKVPRLSFRASGTFTKSSTAFRPRAQSSFASLSRPSRLRR